MTQLTPNQVIEQIHSSFSSAEEELINEAQDILKSANDSERVDRARNLESLGFGNAKPVKKLSRENIEKAEQLRHYKSRYDRIAPMYKFITHEKVLEICDEYGIIIGPSNRYNGDIPEKNQMDIVNFKIEDETYLESFSEELRNFTWKTHDSFRGEVSPSDMSDQHLLNAAKMCLRKAGRGSDFATPVRAFIYEMISRGDKDQVSYLEKYFRSENRMIPSDRLDSICADLFDTTEMTHFMVAADVNSFDKTDCQIEDFELKPKSKIDDLNKRMRKEWFQYYDPIVLAQVKGGYLIVTAWGTEASDPRVHNEKLN